MPLLLQIFSGHLQSNISTTSLDASSFLTRLKCSLCLRSSVETLGKTWQPSCIFHLTVLWFQPSLSAGVQGSYLHQTCLKKAHLLLPFILSGRLTMWQHLWGFKSSTLKDHFNLFELPINVAMVVLPHKHNFTQIISNVCHRVSNLHLGQLARWHNNLWVITWSCLARQFSTPFACIHSALHYNHGLGMNISSDFFLLI